MDNFSVIGRWLVIAGAAILILGGIIWLLGKIPGIHKLPGTIEIHAAGFTCIIPILASLVLSVVLTILLNVIFRIFRR